MFISDTWKSLSKQSLETGRMRRPTSRGLRRTSQHSVFRYGACSGCVILKDLEWKLRWLHTVVELAQTCSNCLINYKGSSSTMLNYFPLTAAVILHRTWSFWRSCSSAKCSLYWCKSFKTWSSMSGNSRSTTQLGPACQHDEEAHDHLSINTRKHSEKVQLFGNLVWCGLPISLYESVPPTDWSAFFFFQYLHLFCIFSLIPSLVILWFGISCLVINFMAPELPPSKLPTEMPVLTQPRQIFWLLRWPHSVISWVSWEYKEFFSAKVTRLALTVMSVLAQFFQFTVWGSTPWGGKYAMQGWESRPKL